MLFDLDNLLSENVAGFIDGDLLATNHPGSVKDFAAFARQTAKGIDALARAGAAEVAVVNRSSDKAEVAAALAGDVGRVGTVADVRRAAIVVNGTSVGMGADPAAGELPFAPDVLHAGQVVADLVYHPLETGLLAAARAAGATCVDGLGMLVYQAALQQELWLGVRPDAAVMRAAALRELAARSR